MPVASVETPRTRSALTVVCWVEIVSVMFVLVLEETVIVDGLKLPEACREEDWSTTG